MTMLTVEEKFLEATAKVLSRFCEIEYFANLCKRWTNTLN